MHLPFNFANFVNEMCPGRRMSALRNTKKWLSSNKLANHSENFPYPLSLRDPIWRYKSQSEAPPKKLHSPNITSRSFTFPWLLHNALLNDLQIYKLYSISKHCSRAKEIKLKGPKTSSHNPSQRLPWHLILPNVSFICPLGYNLKDKPWRLW